jgi:hypothetical protein
LGKESLVKLIPNEARSKNVTRHDFCSWCADTGYVVANRRPAVASAWMKKRELQADGWYEEVAPCPYCEAGYREEFPEPAPSNKYPSKTLWGPDGYWRGIESADLDPLYRPRSAPLSRQENRGRWAELAVKVGFIAKPLDVPLSEREEKAA